MGIRKSDYTFRVIETQGRNVISIIDLDLGHMSVTNNIENVLTEIAEIAKIQPKDYLIVYKDTDGKWDGYDAVNSTFIAVMERTREAAIRRLIERQLKK